MPALKIQHGSAPTTVVHRHQNLHSLDLGDKGSGERWQTADREPFRIPVQIWIQEQEQIVARDEVDISNILAEGGLSHEDHG